MIISRGHILKRYINAYDRLQFATSHADIVGLIRDSLDNWRTKHYDWFQQKTNNIVM
jgi:hypothetical protein